MTDLAWMKTYIGDEAALTGHLNAEEFGAYERLRRHYWQHGGLPSDDVRLMRITGVEPDCWLSVRDAIGPLFAEEWRLPRLDQERELAADKRVRAIEKSQKAAEARWGKKVGGANSNATSIATGNAYAMHGAMLEQCPPAPAPDEVRNDERLAPTRVCAREDIPRVTTKEEAGRWLSDHLFPGDQGFTECCEKMVRGNLTWSDIERWAAA